MYNKYIKHGIESYLQKNSVLTNNKSDTSTRKGYVFTNVGLVALIFNQT